MITIPAGVKIYLACGATDMRKGFDGLSILAQDVLKQDPFLCGGCRYVAEATEGGAGTGDARLFPPHNIPCLWRRRGIPLCRAPTEWSGWNVSSWVVFLPDRAWLPEPLRVAQAATRRGGARTLRGPVPDSPAMRAVGCYYTSGRQNAHRTVEREVLYPWHPWAGSTVLVHEVIEKVSGTTARCVSLRRVPP